MNQELFLRRGVAHRLRSIERHLKEFRDAVPEELGLSLGNMVLADNLDWLDCLAAALERGTVELRSHPVAVGVEEIVRGDDSTLTLRLLHDLHSHLPEDERPMSWMQFTDVQRSRAEAAVSNLARAILALLNPPPTEFAKPTGCDNPVERGRSEGPASATGDSPVGAGPNPSPTGEKP